MRIFAARQRAPRTSPAGGRFQPAATQSFLPERLRPQSPETRPAPFAAGPRRPLPDRSGETPERGRGLVLGREGDRFEREAERTARRAGESTPAPRPVQRVGSLAAQPLVSGELGEEIQKARDGGSPLNPTVRRLMETALAADLSAVRLHDDARADRLSRTLDARAFTLGWDVFFRRGELDPETPPGRRLLTHELTHTVQQAGQSGAPRLIQRSKIDKTTLEGTDLTPIAVLGKQFGRNTPFILKTSGNKRITLNEFNQNGGVGDRVMRVKKVEATLERRRRTVGGRASRPPQTAMGSIGDQERILQEGAAKAGNKTYAGGHLISDKILGLASFREDNLAAQRIKFNSPAYRNLEQIAEAGLLGPTGRKDLNAPISATVDLAYPSGTISVTDTELQKRSILPSSITPTGATLKFVHWVPRSWTLTLEFDKTKFPNHRFRPKNLNPSSVSSFSTSTAFSPFSATGFQFNITPSTVVGRQRRFGGPGSGNKITLTAQQDTPSPTSATATTATTATASANSGFTIQSIFREKFNINRLKKNSDEFTIIKNNFTKGFAIDLVRTVKKRRALSGRGIATQKELVQTFSRVSKSRQNRKRMRDEFKDDPNLDFT